MSSFYGLKENEQVDRTYKETKKEKKRKELS
jgi:hypothetical protein